MGDFYGTYVDDEYLTTMTMMILMMIPMMVLMVIRIIRRIAILLLVLLPHRPDLAMPCHAKPDSKNTLC